MSDLRLVFDPERGCDLALEGFDLASDGGLETAVLVSLFTDAQARPEDVLPPGQTYRRGWWGDAVPPVAGDRIGSRLWLLDRRKQLPVVLVEARGYAEEALAWLLEDGLAARVGVQAFIPRDEVLGLAIEIEKPTGETARFVYESAWSDI